MTRVTPELKDVQKVAVAGVNGFVGKHLVRELVNNGIRVVGIGRELNADSDIAEIITEYIPVDLTVQWPGIGQIDAIINLAGLAAIGPSFERPQQYISLNSAMITNMAEYYLVQPSKPRIIIISSGAIYDPDQAMPLTESSAIGFSSPYAVSKVLAENQCNYYRNRGLDCIIVRPFNHIGPGQLGGFLVPDVIAQLKNGDSLTVGNITTKRDYTDVRDIVKAYRMLATVPKLNHVIYNACSGTSVSGQEIVETLQKILGKIDVKVSVDHSKIRPTDPADIYGDATALKSDTNWSPEISLEQTLADCVTTR